MGSKGLSKLVRVTTGGAVVAALTVLVPTVAFATVLATPLAPTLSETTPTSITVSFTPDSSALSSTITLTDATSTAVATDTVSVGVVSFDFTGLTLGDTYSATITSNGDSTNPTSPVGAASSSLTLITLPLATPGAPTLSETTPGSITVSFTPDPNALSSNITLTDLTSTIATSHTVSGSVASFDFTVLTFGDAFFATITSNGDGTDYSTSTVGTASSTLSLVTLPLATPGAPTLSETSPTSITVSFTPDPNAQSSTITLTDATTSTTTLSANLTTGTAPISGLTVANVYTATITSIGNGTTWNNSSVGTSSSPLTLQALVQLSTPQITTTTSGNGAVALDFQPVTHASSYVATVDSGVTVVSTNSTSCLPTACLVDGLTAGTTYTVTVEAIGDGLLYSDSAPSAASTFVTTAIGPVTAPPPTGVGSNSLGTPVSGTASSSSATNVTLVMSNTTSSLTVPAAALPNGTTVSVYPITSITTLASMLTVAQSYVVAVAVNWQTALGTSPPASVPLTLTITDPSIVAGDTIYLVTSTGLVASGTTTIDGTATVTFSSDPIFMVTAIAKIAQSALIVKTASAPVSHAITLSTSGGSGTGAVGFNVKDGTAKGCSISTAQPFLLTATSYGTCVVSAIKAADTDYGAVSSPTVTMEFTALQQAPLKVTSTHGTAGTPLILHAKGGSGRGAVTFKIANGTARGCALQKGATTALVAGSRGTCLVTAMKGSDSTHSARSSTRAAVRFVQAPIAKPLVTSPQSQVRNGNTSTVVLTGTGLRGDTVTTTTNGVNLRVIAYTAYSLTLSVKVATSVRSGVYQLNVKSKGGVATTTFRVVGAKVVIINPASLVNTLFAGYRSAWAVNATTGLDYAFAHDYPGSVTSQSAFLACFPKLAGGQTGETDTPVLSSLLPDSAWRGVGPDTPAWNFAGKKPSGTTYSVTDEQTLIFSGGPSQSSSVSVHVTILKGVAYFYFVPAC
jgi:hypothetical protein